MILINVMIIYNVTINVEESVHSAWLTYMKENHIPDVLNTGCFTGFTFCRILSTQSDEEGMTYSVQYKCSGIEDYNQYIDSHADQMRQDMIDKFGGKFVAFRTLLEEVE